jgi:hypothetical protein
MRILTIVLVPVLVFLIACAVSAPAQQAPGQSSQQGAPPQAKEPDKLSLEEMLNQALKDNPDIRVAEAKVHEAEAELNRTRITVLQKIVSNRAAWKLAKAKVAAAEQQLVRMQTLMKSAAISQEEYRAAEQAVIVAKGELETVEAEVPALLGKSPLKGSVSQGYREDLLRALTANDLAQSQVAAGLRYLARQQAMAAAAPGSVTEKIHQALETPIKVHFDNLPLPKVLQELRQSVPDITIRDHVTDRTNEVTITLAFKDPLPLRAVLQAIEDELQDLGPINGKCHFVVREYGLLLVPEKHLPPGALLLHEFPRVTATDERAQGSAPAGKNPPPAQLEGFVKAVDAGSGLVTISIGSDAGLAKGHTLEVYRLNPAKYVGTIRIVEVKPNEAVGKPEGKSPSIQVNDKVASKVAGN